MMSDYHVARDEMASPSLQKRPTDDGDSGFDELIDDAATFELLPASVVARRISSRSASPRGQLQMAMLQNREPLVAPAETVTTPSRASEGSVTEDSGYSLTTPEYSPLSPSPRPLIGNGSVSSNASTQPDAGLPEATAVLENGGEGSRVTFLPPSPAGSEEDVSGKGKTVLYKYVLMVKCPPRAYVIGGANEHTN